MMPEPHLWGDAELEIVQLIQLPYFFGKWFPRRIVLFKYDARMIATLSIMYDDERRRRGAIGRIGDKKFKKIRVRRASERPWFGGPS